MRVGPDDGHAILRVQDTGIGLTAALLPRIFDLFTQGDRTLARRQGGLGSGLTLVKRLVQQHGGDVEARSEGPDRGATFIVRLPRVEGSTSDTATARPPVAQASPRRVLVVEDNDDARAMLATALRLAGSRGPRSARGRARIAAALALQPDIALVDLGLPAEIVRAAGVIDRRRRPRRP